MSIQFKEIGQGIGHAQAPASVLNPEPSQLNQWRWFEAKGVHFLCYWRGGDTVDMYGPFIKRTEVLADEVKRVVQEATL